MTRKEIHSLVLERAKHGALIDRCGRTVFYILLWIGVVYSAVCSVFPIPLVFFPREYFLITLGGIPIGLLLLAWAIFRVAQAAATLGPTHRFFYQDAQRVLALPLLAHRVSSPSVATCPVQGVGPKSRARLRTDAIDPNATLLPVSPSRNTLPENAIAYLGAR